MLLVLTETEKPSNRLKSYKPKNNFPEKKNMMDEKIKTEKYRRTKTNYTDWWRLSTSLDIGQLHHWENYRFIDVISFNWDGETTKSFEIVQTQKIFSSSILHQVVWLWVSHVSNTILIWKHRIANLKSKTRFLPPHFPDYTWPVDYLSVWWDLFESRHDQLSRLVLLLRDSRSCFFGIWKPLSNWWTGFSTCEKRVENYVKI